MAAGALRIRNPRPTDESAWRRLWSGYLAFYEAEISEEVTAATWQRLLQPGSSMFGRVAVWQGTVTGFTVCVLHPDSWTLSPACYSEDLFVDPGVRGQGIGRTLIEDLLHTATSATGHRSIGIRASRTSKFYDKFAAAEDFVRYRILLPSEKRKRRRTATGASRRV